MEGMKSELIPPQLLPSSQRTSKSKATPKPATGLGRPTTPESGQPVLRHSASIDQGPPSPSDLTARRASMFAFQPEQWQQWQDQPLFTHSQASPTTLPKGKFATISRAFSRPKSSLLPSTPPVDYLAVPERLRHDLRSLEKNPGYEDTLVRNIKHSIGILSKDQQDQENQESCQQEFLLQLFSRPELRLVECDFSCIFTLRKVLQSSPHRPILMPLFGALTHAFVTDISGLEDLSSKELDARRISNDSEIRETAEQIAKRISYLGADSTPLTRLSEIQNNPLLIKKIGFSKRDALKSMRNFISDVDSGKFPRLKRLTQIKGLFSMFLANSSQHEDDLNFVELFNQANQYLKELKQENNFDFPAFNPAIPYRKKYQTWKPQDRK